jgi:hypothetical protein
VSELRVQVEMMVLSADGMDGMRTCVLRPSNLFGPGDSSLVRFVAGYARSPLGKVFHTEIYLLLLSLFSRSTWYLKMEYFLCGRNVHNCKRLVFCFHVDVISELCCSITLHFASFIMMEQGNGLRMSKKMLT